jgi:hypothetical protein
MKKTACWDIAQCSLAEADGRFAGAHSLRHQGDSAQPHDNNAYIIGYVKLQIPEVERHNFHTRCTKSDTFLKVVREV